MARRRIGWRAGAVAAGAVIAVLLAAAPASADTIREMQWYLATVNATQAHQVTRGDGVIVAVIDSGVDAGHPDLAGAVLPGASFLGSTSKDGQTDPDGHGTKMAGVIAARGGGPNNALGIAPRARILPVAIPNEGQVGSIAEPLRWAVDHGAQVINLSVARPAGQALPAGEADAVAYALAHNVVVVTSAGNRAQMPTGNSLAMLPGVVAVAGLARSGSFWSGSVEGPFVAVAAPAEDIVNIGARNVYSTGYSTGTGTSESTAIVAGIAALVRAKFPQLDAANVINRLIRTAVDRGSAARDPRYGFGTIDALRAVTVEVAPTDANPLGVAAATPSAGPTDGLGSGGGDSGSGAALGRLGLLLGAVACIGLVVLVVVIVAVARSRRRPVAAPPYPGAPPPYPGAPPPPAS